MRGELHLMFYVKILIYIYCTIEEKRHIGLFFKGAKEASPFVTGAAGGCELILAGPISRRPDMLRIHNKPL
ncbi:hypothetical protein [Aquisediminimonas sediminicola]|uniref:hypothetical protein n=1 Tax=Alteraquisediminimonas sediminicola TaxID=2676787 RepID=UPI001C8EBAF3|nr:hypothetical protein [Aquisediminimonas sediminicola]